MCHFVNSNVNFPAPVSVLGFLAACGGIFLSGIAILVACSIHKLKLARLLAALVGVAAIVYFALLFGFSLISQQKILARGQEKYFCEIDCHLAYSVIDIKTIDIKTTGIKTIDIKTAPTSDTLRYIVTLKTRFDETTISSRRPLDATLTPNPREIRLLDGQGRAYGVSEIGGVPLQTPLKPGDSYTTQLQFTLPKDASNLRLLLTAAGWQHRLLIGEENSWLHKKTYFAL